MRFQRKENYMKKGGVLLIGFEDQENLGLRYITSFLKKKKIRIKIKPFQYHNREEILRSINSEKPKIVGFSLIFQRMFDDFKALMVYLRENDVNCHFTMGGHFPSLSPSSTLKLIPELDSVVRFEGEETLLDLYERIDDRDSWQNLKGIAYRNNGKIHINAPRPLIRDLDSLPFPFRSRETPVHRGIGISSILGSRGCFYDCSFCSIHQFYKEPPGPMRRTRSPENIIKEMEELFYDKGIRVFIFQDDEWFMKGNHHIRWIENFVSELKRSPICDEILWRISCRVDDVDSVLLRKMKDVGLMCVYMGIESGNEQGLTTFNKHYVVDDIFRALDVLNEVEMPFEFGFMIFDPGSTFESVGENIRFLEKITEGGEAVAHFSKMVPYAGTTIAEKLEKQGKLKGNIGSPDYGYEDNRLNLLQFFSSKVFNYRNFGKDGLVERLRVAKFDSMILNKFFSTKYDVSEYDERLRDLIQKSNDSALETFNMAVNFMKKRNEDEIYSDWILLDQIAEDERCREANITTELDKLEYDFRSKDMFFIKDSFTINSNIKGRLK